MVLMEALIHQRKCLVLTLVNQGQKFGFGVTESREVSLKGIVFDF